MIDVPVDVVIESVEQARAGVYATVRFANRGDTEVLLDPYNLCRDGVLEAPVFRITDSQGHSVRYTGRLYKRSGPDFSKFHSLQAGGELRITCLLGSGYALSGHEGPFTLFYDVFNMAADGEYFPLASDPVRFGTR